MKRPSPRREAPRVTPLLALLAGVLLLATTSPLLANAEYVLEPGEIIFINDTGVYLYNATDSAFYPVDLTSHTLGGALEVTANGTTLLIMLLDNLTQSTNTSQHSIDTGALLGALLPPGEASRLSGKVFTLVVNTSREPVIDLGGHLLNTSYGNVVHVLAVNTSITLKNGSVTGGGLGLMAYLGGSDEYQVRVEGISFKGVDKALAVKSLGDEAKTARVSVLGSSMDKVTTGVCVDTSNNLQVTRLEVNKTRLSSLSSAVVVKMTLGYRESPSSQEAVDELIISGNDIAGVATLLNVTPRVENPLPTYRHAPVGLTRVYIEGNNITRGPTDILAIFRNDTATALWFTGNRVEDADLWLRVYARTPMGSCSSTYVNSLYITGNRMVETNFTVYKAAHPDKFGNSCDPDKYPWLVGTTVIEDNVVQGLKAVYGRNLWDHHFGPYNMSTVEFDYHVLELSGTLKMGNNTIVLYNPAWIVGITYTELPLLKDYYGVEVILTGPNTFTIKDEKKGTLSSGEVVVRTILPILDGLEAVEEGGGITLNGKRVVIVLNDPDVGSLDLGADAGVLLLMNASSARVENQAIEYGIVLRNVSHTVISNITSGSEYYVIRGGKPGALGSYYLENVTLDNVAVDSKVKAVFKGEGVEELVLRNMNFHTLELVSIDNATKNAIRFENVRVRALRLSSTSNIQAVELSPPNDYMYINLYETSDTFVKGNWIRNIRIYGSENVTLVNNLIQPFDREGSTAIWVGKVVHSTSNKKTSLTVYNNTFYRESSKPTFLVIETDEDLTYRDIADLIANGTVKISFSYGGRGNWWSDHVRVDEDGDGIVDVPYVVFNQSGLVIKDEYPLVEPPVPLPGTTGMTKYSKASFSEKSIKIRIPLGSTKTVTVTLRNTGNADMKVLSLELSRSLPGVLKLGVPRLPKTLAPGEALSFNVSVHGTREASLSADIVVVIQGYFDTSSKATTKEFRIPLNIQVYDPKVHEKITRMVKSVETSSRVADILSALLGGEVRVEEGNVTSVIEAVKEARMVPLERLVEGLVVSDPERVSELDRTGDGRVTALDLVKVYQEAGLLKEPPKLPQDQAQRLLQALKQAYGPNLEKLTLEAKIYLAALLEKSQQ